MATPTRFMSLSLIDVSSHPGRCGRDPFHWSLYEGMPTGTGMSGGVQERIADEDRHPFEE